MQKNRGSSGAAGNNVAARPACRLRNTLTSRACSGRARPPHVLSPQCRTSLSRQYVVPVIEWQQRVTVWKHTAACTQDCSAQCLDDGGYRKVPHDSDRAERGQAAPGAAHPHPSVAARIPQRIGHLGDSGLGHRVSLRLGLVANSCRHRHAALSRRLLQTGAEVARDDLEEACHLGLPQLLCSLTWQRLQLSAAQ